MTPEFGGHAPIDVWGIPIHVDLPLAIFGVLPHPHDKNGKAVCHDCDFWSGHESGSGLGLRIGA